MDVYSTRDMIFEQYRTYMQDRIETAPSRETTCTGEESAKYREKLSLVIGGRVTSGSSCNLRCRSWNIAQKPAWQQYEWTKRTQRGKKPRRNKKAYQGHRSNHTGSSSQFSSAPLSLVASLGYKGRWFGDEQRQSRDPAQLTAPTRRGNQVPTP